MSLSTVFDRMLYVIPRFVCFRFPYVHLDPQASLVILYQARHGRPLALSSPNDLLLEPRTKRDVVYVF